MLNFLILLPIWKKNAPSASRGIHTRGALWEKRGLSSSLFSWIESRADASCRQAIVTSISGAPNTWHLTSNKNWYAAAAAQQATYVFCGGYGKHTWTNCRSLLIWFLSYSFPVFILYLFVAEMTRHFVARPDDAYQPISLFWSLQYYNKTRRKKTYRNKWLVVYSARTERCARIPVTFHEPFTFPQYSPTSLFSRSTFFGSFSFPSFLRLCLHLSFLCNPIDRLLYNLSIMETDVIGSLSTDFKSKVLLTGHMTHIYSKFPGEILYLDTVSLIYLAFYLLEKKEKKKISLREWRQTQVFLLHFLWQREKWNQMIFLFIAAVSMRHECDWFKLSPFLLLPIR